MPAASGGALRLTVASDGFINVRNPVTALSYSPGPNEAKYWLEMQDDDTIYSCEEIRWQDGGTQYRLCPVPESADHTPPGQCLYTVVDERGMLKVGLSSSLDDRTPGCRTCWPRSGPVTQS
jgi:hypothetical protein